MNAQTAGFVTSWVAMACLTLCIALGHDSALVDTLIAINIAALGGIGVKIVSKK